MAEQLDIDSFLDRAQRVPVVDVRSPAEFAQGHLPGAVNVPLFADAERAEIGTVYVREGRQPAVMLGLAKVGPRLAELGARLTELAARADGELLIHCWRGGMRSASVAWLAETLDCRVTTLMGGYKSFRRWVIGTTGEGLQIRVVAGLTGTGKTLVLQALAARGEHVIDLEKLAHHKGSAFGDLGEEKQPTQEQFENDLAMAWRATSSDAPVWVEDESRSIGRCVLPEAFWRTKQGSVFHVLELPTEVRLAHLCEVYGRYPAEVLTARIEGIRKRLGGLRTAAAVDAVRAGEVAQACRIVLGYYDPSYTTAIQKIPADRVQVHSFLMLDPVAMASDLCETLSSISHS